MFENTKLRTPHHVGVIPDGNRRWAVKHGMNKEDGYSFGLDPGYFLLEDLQRMGVNEVTYYGFTVDNCKRPKPQVDAFKKACVEAIKRIDSEEVSLLVVGNTESSLFPVELLPYTIPRIEREEKFTTKVNFLVNYGPEWDLMKQASIEISPIDLVLRWGGMRRLSGFLPMQTVYSDIYVSDVLWPDYNVEQLEDAMVWYQKQDITKGG